MEHGEYLVRVMADRGVPWLESELRPLLRELAVDDTAVYFYDPDAPNRHRPQTPRYSVFVVTDDHDKLQKMLMVFLTGVQTAASHPRSVLLAIPYGMSALSGLLSATIRSSEQNLPVAVVDSLESTAAWIERSLSILAQDQLIPPEVRRRTDEEAARRRTDELLGRIDVLW